GALLPPPPPPRHTPLPLLTDQRPPHPPPPIPRIPHLLLERIGALLLQLLILVIQRLFQRLVLQQQRVHRIRLLPTRAEQPPQPRRLLAILLDLRRHVLDLLAKLLVLLLDVRQLVLVERLEPALGGEQLLLLGRDQLAGRHRPEELAEAIPQVHQQHGGGNVDPALDVDVFKVWHDDRIGD